MVVSCKEIFPSTLLLTFSVYLFCNKDRKFFSCGAFRSCIVMQVSHLHDALL